MDVQTVTASQLVSDSPSEASEAKPRKKLYAEDFPGVTIPPAYPGANHGRHPQTKQFVSLKPKPVSQVEPAAAAASPAPSVPAATVADILGEETRETPQNTPAEAVSGEPAEAAESVGATAEAEAAEAAGAAPDFSDLPSPDKEPEKPADEPARATTATDTKAHRAFVGYLFDAIVAFLAAIFGAEWLPESAAEKNAVVQAWVDALVWMGARVLNPLQLAYAATASYCFTRLSTVWRWWKGRKMKRANVEREETVSTGPEPKADSKAESQTEPQNNSAFSGFSGAGR